VPRAAAAFIAGSGLISLGIGQYPPVIRDLASKGSTTCANDCSNVLALLRIDRFDEPAALLARHAAEGDLVGRSGGE
jgi:hypothetical protein